MYLPWKEKKITCNKTRYEKFFKKKMCFKIQQISHYKLVFACNQQQSLFSNIYVFILINLAFVYLFYQYQYHLKISPHKNIANLYIILL